MMLWDLPHWYKREQFFSFCASQLAPNIHHNITSHRDVIYNEDGEIVTHRLVDVRNFFLLMKRRFDVSGVEESSKLALQATLTYFSNVCQMFTDREHILEFYLYICFTMLSYQKGADKEVEWMIDTDNLSLGPTFEHMKSDTFQTKIKERTAHVHDLIMQM